MSVTLNSPLVWAANPAFEQSLFCDVIARSTHGSTDFPAAKRQSVTGRCVSDDAEICCCAASRGRARGPGWVCKMQERHVRKFQVELPRYEDLCFYKLPRCYR